MEQLTILHLTDLHNRGNLNLQSAAKVIAEKAVELVVLSGDLTQFGDKGAVEKTLQILNQELEMPIFYVTGNLDAPGAYSYSFKHVKPLEGHKEQFKGIQFVGLSGSNKTPFHTPYELTETEISEKLTHLKTLLEPNLPFILVSHVPPFDSGADILNNGKAVGSLALRDFIVKEKPLVVCTGHIHESKSIARLNSTLVINPGPALYHNAALVQLSWEDLSNVDIQAEFIVF